MRVGSRKGLRINKFVDDNNNVMRVVQGKVDKALMVRNRNCSDTLTQT